MAQGWWLAEWTSKPPEVQSDTDLWIWGVIIAIDVALLYARAFVFVSMLVDIASKLHNQVIL